MTIEDIIMKAITLEDEEYFQITEDNIHELGVTEKLFEHRFQGILINAPKKIDLANRESIPCLGINSSDGLRDWYTVGNANSIVVISKSTGKIIATKPSVIPKKRKIFRAPIEKGEPPEYIKDQFGAGSSISDMRKIVAENTGLNLKPDNYVITVTGFDWKSNSIQIELVDSRIEEPTENIPPMQFAKPDLFLEVLNRPEDKQKGLEFTLPEKITTSDTSVILKASFPVDSITPLEFRTHEQEQLKTIPFHLILLKQFQNHDPIYSVPVVAAYTSNSTEGNAAYLEIDLRKLAPTALTEPGKYYCYLAGFNLFSDAQMVIVKDDGGGE